MAVGKKSIIIYSDWIELFESLSDEEAGKLVKHFFRYVNDLNPIAPDRLTEISFVQIKQSLKRDLVKWEETRLKRSKGGKASAEKRNKIQHTSTKPTHVKSVQHTSTHSTDSVNVSVSVNDIKDISYTTLEDCVKLFLEKTAFNWTEQYAKKQAETFYNFYSAKGWLIGKNKMKSLGHAIGGWISRQDKPETINTPVDRNKTEKIIFY